MSVIYTEVEATVTTTVASDPTIITIVTEGPQGAPGGMNITCTTEIALSGHRFIVLDDDMAVYADNTILDHAHRVVGMTTGASNEGSVSVQTSGEHDEPTWAWTLGVPVFLGINGMLTQTPPSSGFSLVVGFPITATKLYIKIQQPLILA